MKSRFTLLIVLIVISAQAATAQFSLDPRHRNRRGGALLGGLAGAAIGVAIGDRGNNETAGALIGGAVGAVAGGAIGDAKDRRINHNRIYHSNHHSNFHSGHHSPQYVVPGHSIHPPVYNVEPVHPTPAGNYVQPLTTHDVVTMVRSGLSEMMVINQIRYRGMAVPLSVSELIGLHQQGISEPILEAMQGTLR
ncbi:hypothetical protein LF1_01510 [Rubripirellula obstinata]|uniref:Glycine zipper domain-containing protein n=1 Tax=Rubripirellula obstinata TaxID=406547 RepID=A0A5B1CDX2_9BACT|nr:glycine zipper domain-containing protein [Rubripirellula obstinata]KAA1257663.1 hypothetical protein LF1_01510 [Rubripirellula obstinata]